MELKVMADTISDWINDRVDQANAEGVVVGLSGGIDSTVVAMLAGQAVRTTGLILPCGSDPKDWDDAQAAAESCSQSTTLSLSPAHGVLAQLLSLYDDGSVYDGQPNSNSLLPLANLKSRLRMAVLYFYANTDNLLVCGTTNKSELLTGYYTKYGDGGVDIEPIADLWKTDVRKLAAYLDVPKEIIEKPPTAGLWSGQTDEAELGMDYERLDLFLKVIHNAVQQGEAVEPELVVAESQEAFGRVIKLVARARHKREPAPCCVLTKEAKFVFKGRHL